jgi:hypothetical protein
MGFRPTDTQTLSSESSKVIFLETANVCLANVVINVLKAE